MSGLPESGRFMRWLPAPLRPLSRTSKRTPPKRNGRGWRKLWVVASMKRTHSGFFASRCECSMALCQPGDKAGYQRTVVRHKFAVSIGFTASYQPPKSTTFLAMRDQDLTCQNCGPSSSLRLHAHFPEDELPELRCLECVTCGEVVLVERVTSSAQPHVIYWRETGY